MACANPSPSTHDLHDIYDHEYLLRWASTSENPDVYRFESCRTTGDLSENPLCVNALETQNGTPITFSLQELSELTLTEEEEKELNRRHSSWEEYQKALRKRFMGRMGGLAVAIGGTGFLAASRYGVNKLKISDLSEEGIQMAQKQITLLGPEYLPPGITHDEAILMTVKRSSRAGEIIVAIIVVGATIALIKLTDHTQKPRSDLEETIKGHNQLQEALKHFSSQAKSVDSLESLKVTSVRDTLAVLSRWQNLSYPTPQKTHKLAHKYCLPLPGSDEQKVKKQCYHATIAHNNENSSQKLCYYRFSATGTLKEFCYKKSKL